MLNVKIQLSLYVHQMRSVQEIFIQIQTIESKFYTVQPGCEVIKIDLIVKQDSGWLVLFVLQYSRT